MGKLMRTKDVTGGVDNVFVNHFAKALQAPLAGGSHLQRRFLAGAILQ